MWARTVRRQAALLVLVSPIPTWPTPAKTAGRAPLDANHERILGYFQGELRKLDYGMFPTT